MTKLMIKIVVAVVLIIAIAVSAIAVYTHFASDKEKITVDKARISDVRTMVHLCSMEIYNEVPVLDTINSKVICAVQKQRGGISFDVENLQIDAEGDTVRIILPREIVNVLEATDDNSWQVIDTKYIGFLGSIRNSRLTEREESRVKAKLKRKAIDRLYADGTVRHARREAAKNLEMMMENIYRKPVVIFDPNPAGTRR